MKIKVGIVGAGSAGINIHGSALTAGKIPTSKFSHRSQSYDAEGLYEITGFYDISLERAEKAARLFGAKAYDDYLKFLSSDVELVVIATRPHSTHTPLSIQALEKGKDVVVEKPIAMTSSEAQGMIDAAKKYKRILTVHQSRRWNLDFLCVKEILKKNLLGKVQIIKQIKPAGEKSGGLLHEFGSHCIDQMLVLAGEFPYEVSAIMENPLAKDYAFGWFDISVRFKNAPPMEVGILPSEGYIFPCWYIKGEKGWWVQDWCDRCEDLFQKIQKKSKLGYDYLPEFLQIRPKILSFYRNLYEVIREGKELMVRPEESRDGIRVMELAVESAKRKETIKI